MTGWPTGINDSLRSITFSLGSGAGLPLYHSTDTQDGHTRSNIVSHVPCVAVLGVGQ